MRPAGVGPSLGRVSRFLAILQATLLILALCSASGAAQSIVVRVGDETTVGVAPGAEIEIPVVVDMAQAGGLDIASLTFELTWDPSVLSYVKAVPGTFGSVVFNEADVASGLLATSLFNATGTTNTFTAINIVLSADLAAENQEVCIAVDVTAAGDGNGTDILGSVSEANLCLCVGFAGLLGDVSDDGTVNIIDAQQIARYSVGLPPPPDPAMVEARGDVNEDGQHNIIDAQQIARWTVGLPVPESPGIGQPMPGGTACGDRGITGEWEGTIEGAYPLTLWLDDVGGSVTGTGVVLSTVPMVVTGSRTGYEVTLTMDPEGYQPFVFTGVWDGEDDMTGVTNGSGFVDSPTYLTRISESEPNNTPATADALYDHVSGTVDPAGDIDYWTFWAEAGNEVTISASVQGGLDPRMELLGGDGETPLASGDNLILFSIPATGSYFLTITDGQAQGGPGYEYDIYYQKGGNGQIQPGQYSGTTSQTESITFVSTDGNSIASGLKIVFFACQFCKTTITLNISLPLTDGSFSYSSSNFSISGSAESKTTLSGSASYTPSGAPPECGTCQTVDVTWTASWVGPPPAPGSAATGVGDLSPKLCPSKGCMLYEAYPADMVIRHWKPE